MSQNQFVIRPYAASDEDAAIELWRRTWQIAYPDIDFTERVTWWRERWRDDTVKSAAIFVAEQDGGLAGFVTVNASSGYLDQIVVAPEAWGSGLADTLLHEAKALSPRGLDLHVNVDNGRAISFCEKHGFDRTAESVNPRSGRPVYLMRWRPGA